MNRFIFILLTIFVTNSCANNKNSTDMPTETKEIAEQSITTPSKEELEKVLNDFKNRDILPVKYTFVEKIDGQYVLNDTGYPSASKKNVYYFISKIFIEREIYGIFEYYAILNMDVKLKNYFTDLSDDIPNKIFFTEKEDNIGNIGLGSYPVQRHLGKIADTKFYMRYDNEKEVDNHTPKHIIQCGDKTNSITQR